VLYKSIDTITEADLQALVSEGRREDSQLEFKLTLPGSTDDEKREFLKDVSAMTNSQVGDIIYGIREDRTSPEDAGKAAELVGIITALLSWYCRTEGQGVILYTMATIFEIEKLALTLPEQERAMLAANLLDSLPGVLSDEDEGVAEALRRDANINKNPDQAISLAQLDSQIQNRRR